MTRSVFSTAIATSLLLVNACSTSQPRTEVTRFHLGTPIPAESVVLQAAEGQSDASLEFLTYQRFVSEELAGLGFTPAADTSDAGDESAGEASADLVAEIAVNRGLRAKAPKRSGMSIGIGGGSRGSKIGIGGGLSIPIGGSKAEEVYATELKVTLIRVSTQAVVWEGTASRETPQSPENPADMTRQLAADLFADFPGESGRTTLSDPDTDE